MQVPLGVLLLLNENKMDEMCRILDELHKYVPGTTTEGVTLPNGQVFSHEDYNLIKILLGGDQLTVARVCGAGAATRMHGTALMVLYMLLRIGTPGRSLCRYGKRVITQHF